jgi:hypothetical protein
MWLPPDEYQLWLLAWRRRVFFGAGFGVGLALLLGWLLR